MAGGGTGGHILPALAVARELRARGHDPFFIGARKGLEATLVPRAGFPIDWIDIGGLQGVGLARQLRTLGQLPLSIAASWRFIARRRPAAVFSMGGYAAGPPVAAALLRRLPVIMMEPNAEPGFTTRRLGRYAHRGLISFPEAAAAFPPGCSELTGLPVRPEFFAVPPRIPSSGQLNVLVTGGSQGSRTLNNAVLAAWPLIEQAGLPVRLVLQCGKAMEESLTRELPRVTVSAFLHDMPAAFAEADLVVSRAGAGTVSELCAAGKACLLVPFPHAAGDHQKKNAEAMVRAGAARMAEDADLTGERLFAEFRDALASPETLTARAAAARLLAKPNAAARAAAILEQFAVETIDAGSEKRNNSR
jgi:UDP-N-acetylglucosamine--N-acetylmuramyl-(pentapeptide) pyrophosphoryl-undecaprenol N-acetylglucosamine transferase